MHPGNSSLAKLKDHWIRLFLLLALVSGLAFFTARLVEIPSQSALRGWDNSFYLFWLRSAVIDGDLDFANELEENNTIAAEYEQAAENLTPTPLGKVPNKYGIGWALSSLPWYLAADVSVRLVNLTGLASVPRDGYGPVYQVFLQAGHLLYALAGLMALARWLSRRFDPRDSKLGVLLLWLTSPLLYYQTTNLSMSHNLVFVIIAFLLLLCDYPDKIHRPALRLGTIGFLAGLCLVTRFQSAPFLLLPLALLVSSNLKGRTAEQRRLLVTLWAGIAGFLVPVVLQMTAWKLVYGEWLLFTYGKGGESFSWGSPELVKVLFHPYHGLFYWHPFLLAGFAGLVMAAISREKILAFAVAAFLLTTYINASWHTWQFGASFGHRGFIGTLPFMAAGLAWLSAGCRTPLRVKFFLGFGSLLALFNIWLCILYSVNTIDRNGPVLPADIVAGSAEFMRLAVGIIK